MPTQILLFLSIIIDVFWSWLNWLLDIDVGSRGLKVCFFISPVVLSSSNNPLDRVATHSFPSVSSATKVGLVPVLCRLNSSLPRLYLSMLFSVLTHSSPLLSVYVPNILFPDNAVVSKGLDLYIFGK